MARTLDKLAAAQRRGYLRSVDLFAGCGGMTLGFDRAGVKCVAAVEINDHARASHQTNFMRRAPEEGYAAFSDITQVSPEEAVRHLTKDGSRLDEVVDVVVGGPPCQAFSRLGRAALWRLAGEDYAHAQDKRATMYLHFLHYVAALQPLAFVMENVREIGKFVGRNIAEEIAVTAEELGYETRYSLLNAAWFGVPQFRERMLIVGVRKELAAVPSFPQIGFTADIPGGYSTARAGAGHQQVLKPDDHYVDHHASGTVVRPAVTAREALSDLPPILEHLDGKKGKGVRRDPYALTMYATSPTTEYIKQMRTWDGFEADADTFAGHVIRYTPRDYETFRRMPEGAEYPAALAIAEQVFVERLSDLERVLGRELDETSEEWQELRRRTVPPYKVGRYPNKFSKMLGDRPARTVAAHIGKDSYSHIHYDSDQARCISLREAARLQSFPDGFRFEGSMNAQLTQIGNAVPPLLAYAVAKELSHTLGMNAEIAVPAVNAG